MTNELVKTKGVILKTMDYKEKDKLVYVFSEDFGKVTLICKGARGKSSRFASSIMPLNICNFVIFTGKNIHNLNEINIINTFPGLKTDYEVLTYGLYFLELCDIAMSDNEVNNPYFLDLIKSLYLLDSKSIDIKILARAFELKTLIRTGNFPDPEIHGGRMSAGARGVVRFMMNKGLEELLGMEVPEKDLVQIEALTEEMIRENFQRKPKSLDILKEEI